VLIVKSGKRDDNFNNNLYCLLMKVSQTRTHSLQQLNILQRANASIP